MRCWKSRRWINSSASGYTVAAWPARSSLARQSTSRRTSAIGAAGEPSDGLDHFGIGLVGELQMQGELLAVEHVHEGLGGAIGPLSGRGRKSPPHAAEHVKDVLAGAQRVGAEVGA